MTFMTFLSFRPGIGVLGPPRSLPHKTPRTPIPGRNLRKLQKFKKVKKVRKIGCGPCGRPQAPDIRVLGPPRSLPRASWGLPQGPQPIFLTFMTLTFVIFLTFMTFLTFLTFMTFFDFFEFSSW